MGMTLDGEDRDFVDPDGWREMTVLMVALSFPPRLDAEALQTAKAHKYLSTAPKTRVHLVTSRETSNPLSLLKPAISHHEDRSEFDLFDSRYVNYAALRYFPGWASRPDIKAHAIRRAEVIAKTLPVVPDVIVSRSYPISAALLGQKLSEYLSVPWIMQLSDPWSLSPLHGAGYARAWNTAKEEEAFNRADLITFTSLRTLENYRYRYPQLGQRMRYFPNTYDPADVRPNPWVKGNRLRLVYAGTLGGSRTPEAFCEAFERFLEERPEAASDIEVIIAGHASRSVRAYLAERRRYINYIGPIDFVRSIELLLTSDILILIDNKEKEEMDGKYEFFPSKLLDYMISGRRIIAITGRNSVAHNFVLDSGVGRSMSHGDRGAIVQELDRVWRMWREGDRETFEVKSVDETYDARRNALVLRAEMERLVRARVA